MFNKRNNLIFRYRVIIADDINQTGRNFHLASIHFSTSKSDVNMCLTIFDHNHEIINIEGKGSLVVPAICFMRSTTNISPSRPTSKTEGNGSFKRNNNNTHRGSTDDLTTVYKERIRSVSLDKGEKADPDGSHWIPLDPIGYRDPMGSMGSAFSPLRDPVGSNGI